MRRLDPKHLADCGADRPLGKAVVALGKGTLHHNAHGRPVACVVAPTTSTGEWLVVARDGQFAYASTVFKVVGGERHHFFSRGGLTLADVVSLLASW